MWLGAAPGAQSFSHFPLCKLLMIFNEVLDLVLWDGMDDRGLDVED
jgi:hypothetical protein